METKVCIRCNETKPVENFYRDKQKKDGRTPYCKPCRQEKAKIQYSKPKTLNHAREYGRSRRARDPLGFDLRRMGITKEKFLDLVEKQDNKCAICRQPETYLLKKGEDRVRRLSVDHDYKCCDRRRDLCGECIRELLCARCNQVLGLVKDNIDLLNEMARYLKKHDKY